MKIFHLKFIISVLIAFVVVIVFQQSVHENFVWDDNLFMNLSSLYQGKEGIKNAFAQQFSIVDIYYRPLVTATFSIIGYDQDGGALRQHAFNLFLHAVTSVLVFLCCLEIMLQRERALNDGSKKDTGPEFAYAVSFLCAIVYATHPLTVEPVAWISGRFDLMLTTALLLFIYIDLKMKDGTVLKWLLLFLTYFLAAGSKEMAAMLPFVLPFIYLIIYRNSGKPGGGSFIEILKTKKWTFIAIITAGLLYLAVRIYNIGGIFPEKSSIYANISTDCLLCRPMYSARAVLEFMKLIFLPSVYLGPLHPYDFPEDPWIIISGIAIWITSLTLAVYFMRRNNLAIPFLVFIIIAFPTLRLTYIPMGEQLIANRFAMPPFALFVITFFPVWSVFIWKSVSSLRKPTVLILAAAALVWASVNVIITMQTIPFWSTSDSIFTYMYRMHPDSPFARRFYITMLLSQGRNEEVQKIFFDRKNHSEEIVKLSLDEILQMAVFNMNAGKHEEAKKIIMRILNDEKTRATYEGTSKLAPVYCALMGTEFSLGNLEQSVTAGEISLNLAPDRVYCRIIYADVLYKSGRISDALKNKEIVMSNSLPEVRDEMQRVASQWKNEESVEQ